MLEKERLEIINYINNNFLYNLSKKEKLINIKNMFENESEDVKRYLKILNQIEYINKKIEGYNTKESAILEGFHSKIKNDYKCSNHNMFMYLGSYGTEKCDSYISDKIPKLRFDENCKDFLYNIYRCINCGEKILHLWKNWEEIESLPNTILLKSRYDFDFSYYQEFYYKTLYEKSIEESQLLLLNEFERKNKGKNLSKVNKRSN